MTRMLAFATTLLALAVAAPATVPISITRAGFAPSPVTIKVGDTVVWTNLDSQDHQIVRTRPQETFASPVLKPRDTFTHTFLQAGRFRYESALPRPRPPGQHRGRGCGNLADAGGLGPSDHLRPRDDALREPVHGRLRREGGALRTGPRGLVRARRRGGDDGGRLLQLRAQADPRHRLPHPVEERRQRPQ
jgi:plastocyanin